MNGMKATGSMLLALVMWPSLVAAQSSWQPLTNQPSFNASSAHLLTDGTVMVQRIESSDWYLLTPDAFGDYVNGTWTQLASMSPDYGPLYYASAVLADGRVVVEGGEYNISGPAVWTNKGAIYNPVFNTWTTLAPPAGWANIGDAQGTVLADGTFLLASPSDTRIAVLDPLPLTYTNLNPPKDDRNDEEGWTLLPDGSVLTVDAIAAPLSQRYIPSLNQWVSAGSTIVRLEDPGSQELGPAVLRPDGTVFATGATGQNAIYDIASNTWLVGPDFPFVVGEGQYDVADGPASLLPNGNVLVGASPGIFQRPTHFFEFDGANLTQVADIPNGPTDSSYYGRMLLLPTGQVLFTDGSGDIEVYTSDGVADPAWAPTIASAPADLQPGLSYPISGTQFNGLSQGAAYGDDAQSATNYPLVRITNRASGHVFYARTHGHSTMGVATGNAMVSTSFDVPASVELGVGDLVVVANGVPSASVTVTISASAKLGTTWN
ncbi:MAG TPA: hypothetical protein VOA41_18435 [Candidatus Dormibacteraeota bacterium]|nr:hypothetical protein [Candidatus Dormibacteraeota bacterium]